MDLFKGENTSGNYLCIIIWLFTSLVFLKLSSGLTVQTQRQLGDSDKKAGKEINLHILEAGLLLHIDRSQSLSITVKTET